MHYAYHGRIEYLLVEDGVLCNDYIRNSVLGLLFQSGPIILDVPFCFHTPLVVFEIVLARVSMLVYAPLETHLKHFGGVACTMVAIFRRIVRMD